MLEIGISRFTDETYKENLKWKQAQNYTGSVYGFDREIPLSKFNYMGVIYVIDIRCSANTKKTPPHIYGIGELRFINKEHKCPDIYQNREYNRFMYFGEHYLTKQQLIIDKESQETITLLEKMLCSGPRHFKRGDGLTKLSYERIMSFNPSAKPIKQRCSKCGKLKKGHVCKKEHSKIRFIRRKRCKICQNPLKQNGGLAHICPGRKKNTEFLKQVIRLIEKYKLITQLNT
jgi:hypothetical protein